VTTAAARRSAVLLLLMAGALVATTGCSPAASADPSSVTGSGQPSMTSPAAPAALTVTSSGSVRCGTYACQASIWFEPVGDRKATISPEWFGDASHQFRLSTETARDGSLRVGKIVKPPATLDQGTYLVVAATEILSDIASEAPGPTKVFPVLGTSLECSAPVTVGPDTTSIRIKVAFRPDDPCRVTATAD
jgi:hypothetical protein